MNIVAVNNQTNELTTTSLAIAEGTGYVHASVIKLVRSHADKLERLGLLRFEIQPRSPGQHGGGNVQYALLTEPQATLLLTFMRNSPVVVRFKVRLVEEFYRMKEQLKNTQAPAQLSRVEILEMALEAERQAAQVQQVNTILRLKNEEQVTELARARPAVEFKEDVEADEQLLLTREAAKVLNLRPTDLDRFLESIEWMGKNRKPRQMAVNSGYMKLKVNRFDTGYRCKIQYVPYVTGKGLTKLHAKLGQSIN